MYKIFIMTVALVFAIQSVWAQKSKKGKGGDDGEDSKSEIKEWKKRKKEMDPLKFKSIYEEYGTLQGEATRSRKQLDILTAQIQEKQAALNERTEKAASLAAEYENAKKEAEQAKEEAQRKAAESEVLLSPTSNEDFSKGIVYQVETGAKRDPSLSEYQKYGNFWQTHDGGEKRYVIAYFRDYWEADAFKNMMRKIGVADAYVYSYKDGKPIGMQDARKSSR